MKILALAGEGKGEVKAVPALAAKVLRSAGVVGWTVRSDAIRIPRANFVDQSKRSPRRPPRRDGFEKAQAIAVAGGANALLVLVDSDGDCPSAFGPPAATHFSRLPGAAVMAVQEYETWLLLSREPAELANAGIRAAENKRGAKELLRKLESDYLPTTHQLALTRRIEVHALRSRSQSFDKFAREVLRLTQRSQS